LQRLVIRSIGRVQFVEASRIDWLEARGNYVEIHVGKDLFLHRERLHVLAEQLDPAEFVRIHRSIIVQRAAVKELRPLAGGDYRVVLHDGKLLRLSRTHRAALDTLMIDH
jgi:two-component system LytT family response regulator